MSEILAGIELAVRPYLSYFLSPTGNMIFSLMIFILAVSSYFIGRHWLIFYRLERSRKKIPLVIGGWGTRGKSGTERLKAALFTSRGYHVVAKTTGSAAMFIRSIPGRDPLELYIYRPYEKASIWEQRDMLDLAARSRAQVFLWECMALNRRYVQILQKQWMRDDISTITNAFADHEDVQGPSGFDVAQVISEFIPRNSKAVTSEVQMLPLLKEEARRQNCELSVVSERDWLLMPRQILKRFPYEEHPTNVALVLKLAEKLGFDSEESLIEMSERVVPDVGVLKTFRPVYLLGREIIYINGHSANERAGFMNNWRRTGFDEYGLTPSENRWVVTLVNNRADRIARSQVFARIIVEDIFAHRHILAGTNLKGMRGFIDESLKRYLKKQMLIKADDYFANPADEMNRAETRLANVRRLYRMASSSAEALEGMLSSLGIQYDKGRINGICSEWLDRCANSTLEEIESAILAEGEITGLCGGELAPFAAELLARHLVFDDIQQRLMNLPSNSGVTRKDVVTIDDAFRSRRQQFLMRSIVMIEDAGASGDSIIKTMAQSIPPGFSAKIMGMQNIKGPGLELLSRLQSYETVMDLISRLDSGEQRSRMDALTGLLSYGNYGKVDGEAALKAVNEIMERNQDVYASALLPGIEKLREILKHATDENVGKEKKHGSKSPPAWILSQLMLMLDFIRSIGRTRRAMKIRNAILAGRISQSGAARELLELSQMQKGGGYSLPGRKRGRRLR